MRANCLWQSVDMAQMVCIVQLVERRGDAELQSPPLHEAQSTADCEANTSAANTEALNGEAMNK